MDFKRQTPLPACREGLGVGGRAKLARHRLSIRRRVPEVMTSRARELRSGATEAERLLWRALSPYRPRFTRQLVVGPFIIDIACRQAKLAIELDGGQHATQTGYDEARTVYLKRHGWKVVRLWNHDVLANLDGAAQVVVSEAAECLGGTHPQPLPASREGSK